MNWNQTRILNVLFSRTLKTSLDLPFSSIWQSGRLTGAFLSPVVIMECEGSGAWQDTSKTWLCRSSYVKAGCAESAMPKRLASEWHSNLEAWWRSDMNSFIVSESQVLLQRPKVDHPFLLRCPLLNLPADYAIFLSRLVSTQPSQCLSAFEMLTSRDDRKSSQKPSISSISLPISVVRDTQMTTKRTAIIYRLWILLAAPLDSQHWALPIALWQVCCRTELLVFCGRWLTCHHRYRKPNYMRPLLSLQRWWSGGIWDLVWATKPAAPIIKSDPAMHCPCDSEATLQHYRIWP